MAGNRKKSTAEQLEGLKAKYAAQEQQLQAQKEELARLKSKTAKLKLIPRPKGQAGRGKNGYNLQKEMKLQNDSARFQRIERITRAYANWYLPTGKTIKEQDKTKLEKLIRLLQKGIKYFQRFQGGWPIYAIVKQYLRNCNEKLRRDLRLERAAEAADGADFTDAGGNGEAPDVGDGDASDEDVDVEGSDVEMEQEDSTEDDFVDDSAKQLQAASWDNAVMNEAVDTPQGRKGSAKENFVPASEDISVRPWVCFQAETLGICAFLGHKKGQTSKEYRPRFTHWLSFSVSV
ncbi:hypothetical protein C8R45DRAFT_970012 [Mycena sanguinolenta]|nr:hypothetical protein C8R45DRAFT_970012 [Mycena sanguinolenta]